MSVSPMPPDTTTDTSSTLTVSRMYDDTPPPLNVAATVMPLTAMRPSLAWPPRALKNVIVGVTATPLLSTVSPGVALSREPTVRVRGNRGNRVGGEHGFTPHALHVHDRRLAGDGDGFLEAADAQLDGNRQRGRAAQHDALRA